MSQSKINYFQRKNDFYNFHDDLLGKSIKIKIKKIS